MRERGERGEGMEYIHTQRSCKESLLLLTSPLLLSGVELVDVRERE